MSDNIGFELSDKEMEMLKAWDGYKNCHWVSFTFTPTGIGTKVVVTNNKNESLDITDYDSW